jgi:hypothetical protein
MGLHDVQHIEYVQDEKWDLREEENISRILLATSGLYDWSNMYVIFNFAFVRNRPKDTLKDKKRPVLNLARTYQSYQKPLRPNKFVQDRCAAIIAAIGAYDKASKERGKRRNRRGDASYENEPLQQQQPEQGPHQQMQRQQQAQHQQPAANTNALSPEDLGTRLYHSKYMIAVGVKVINILFGPSSFIGQSAASQAMHFIECKQKKASHALFQQLDAKIELRN